MIQEFKMGSGERCKPSWFSFNDEEDEFGRLTVKDLVPNGRDIPVTEDDKLDHVNKLCCTKMAKDIEDQIESFLEGSHEIIPSNLISIFTAKESELMISELPDIASDSLPLLN